MESVNSEPGQLGDSAQDNVDRIVLRRAENDRLQGWVLALNARFDGMIRVTKSDLANFLVRQHAEHLSESEIAAIESEQFDEVRWLNWALGKVRQAKREGESLSLNELMLKRESIMAKRVPARRRSGARAKRTRPEGETPIGDSVKE